ncbi:MAG: CapA family protein [Culicoidibacterales bacterium]
MKKSKSLLANRRMIVTIVLLGFMIGFSSFLGWAYGQRPYVVDGIDRPLNQVKPEVENSEKLEPNEQEEEPTVTSATFVGTGDILIHYTNWEDAQTGPESFDFRPAFAAIKPIVEQADFAFVNEETIPGGIELGLQSYPMFNSPSEVIDALADTGFNLVQQASNHTFYQGEAGIANANLRWEQYPDVAVAGSYTSQSARDQIVTLEMNGIKVAFLAYTYGTNGIPLNQPYNVNLIERELIIADVQAAQKLADMVVVGMHWGDEDSHEVNEMQREYGQLLADLGVQLVVGTHPHVLQPVEWLTGSNGNQTYVIWSMGNALSTQLPIPNLTGGLFGITIDKIETSSKVEIRLRDPFVVPTWNAYTSDYRNFLITPFDQVDVQTFPGDFAQHQAETEALLRTYIPDLAILSSTDF